MKKLIIFSLLACALAFCLSSCGFFLMDSTTAPACEHQFSEWMTIKEPSCIENGLQAHICNVCQQTDFKTIPVIGHTEVIDQAVAPTCTQTGLTEGKHCSACNTTIVAQKIVAVKKHTEVIDQAVAPTCTQTGLTEGKHCSVCENTIVVQQVVAAKGHKRVIDKAVAPTCTETGLTQGAHCSVCSTVITAQQTVAALGHHDGNNDLKCDACGIALTYTRDGNYIYFGEYPQAIKADNVTITETVDARGYYLGSDENYYAKVVATPYGSYTFSSGAEIADGATYYFKVEPIRWRILSTDGQTALLLCDSIIANQKYDTTSNNYKDSDIRAWLNDNFYATAFSDLQQQIILTTTVNNGVETTGYSSNRYACENTQDKVFLLSHQEMTNTVYGFASVDKNDDAARQMQTSDYSRATGVWMDTDSAYYGNGSWWLRSPCSYLSISARYVKQDGSANNSNVVSGTICGVVAALQIRL